MRCFVVGEGAIDEDRAEWWLDAYVCVNELAERPPAIGKEPPERFRQRGTGGRWPRFDSVQHPYTLGG